MPKAYWNKERIFLFSAIFLAVIFLIGAFYYLSSTKTYVRNIRKDTLRIAYDPFEDMEIEGQSAYVYDIKNQNVLFSKNHDVKLPLASITKVMTSLVAMENLPPSDTVTILPTDLFTEGESGLIPYEVWKARDLIDFTLIVSSNDGAEALRRSAEAVTQSKRGESFIETMNSRAREIGMTGSVFYNPTGLDEGPSRAGAYSTAEDVSALFGFILANYPFLVEESAVAEETFTSFSGYSHWASNTNLLARTIPDLIASKTGFTDLAGGNLAIIAEPEENRPVIIVVLASSLDGRFADVGTLYKRASLYVSAERKIAEFERDMEEVRQELL